MSQVERNARYRAVRSFASVEFGTALPDEFRWIRDEGGYSNDSLKRHMISLFVKYSDKL